LSSLEIRPLTESDAAAVSGLLTADPPEYRRHFEPFPGDPASVAGVLAAAADDRFWGIFAERDELAALVMLRGLDAGYSTPAFGVYVAERRSRSGLAKLALAFAEAWCRLNRIDEIMLTVHPENDAARGLYEREGFSTTGAQSDIGHLVYRKGLATG
jgi:GNAT superfamily N-acetyltransferase